MAKWSPSPSASPLAQVVPGASVAADREASNSAISHLPPRTNPAQEVSLYRAMNAIPTTFGAEEPRRARPPTTPKSTTDPYDPFFIPHSILFNTPISPQQNSALLQLPTEILTHIFKNVKIPYFQVCLALTCKTMGLVASQKNAMAPWRGYRDKDGLFRLLQRNHYIPSSLRLCRSCFRFLEQDPEYWSQAMKSTEFDAISINWFDILGWMDADPYSQHSCPWCSVGNHLNYHSQQRYLNDRMGLNIPSKMKMCPDLNRRMDRP